MVEPHKKYRLGNRAFFLFLSRRFRPVLLLLIVAGAIWWSERWLPLNYVMWGDYAARMVLALTGAYFVLVLLQAWLEYRYYTYTFTDEALIMTYGYIMRNEVGALYHQIQNVNIVRSPMDRIAGVSQIVIFMIGGERDTSQNKIVLPAVGKNRAKLVQKELLVRARKRD
jgi:membrane protein YdbS with pleckstrin-like domain